MLSLLQLHSVTLAERPAYKVKNKGHQPTTNNTVWGWKLEISKTRRERQSWLSKVRLVFFKWYNHKHTNHSSAVKISWIFHYDHGLQVSEPHLQMLWPPWSLGTVSGEFSPQKKPFYVIVATLFCKWFCLIITSTKWLLKKAIPFYSKFHKIKI